MKIPARPVQFASPTLLNGMMRAKRRYAILLLTAATGAVAPCAHAQTEGRSIGVAQQGLVVGSDDRRDVNAGWLVANPRYAGVVDAIGIFKGRGIQCTASYIGGGLAITAGHCVNAGASESHNVPCPGVTVSWGFRSDAAPYLVSQCVRVLAAKKLEPTDYAVFEVSPLPRAEIHAVHNAGSSSGVTSPGVMLSHPKGRPLTWSGACSLPPYGTGIAHDCDSEPGSSGALMLEDSDLLAIGIHYGNSGALNSAVYLAHTPVGDIMDDRFAPHGRIASAGSGCLDVTDRKTADRTPIQLWHCSGESEQAWTLSPYGTITGLGGKCLDTPFSTPGTRTWLFTCHYRSNQMWRFENPEIRIENDFCLDVPGIRPAAGTRVQIWKCHGGDGQKWIWNSEHQMRNIQGRCLSAASVDAHNGTAVVLDDCRIVVQQAWDLMKGGKLRGIGGLCVDVTNGKFGNGTPLQLYECTGSRDQRWFLRGAIHGLDNTCLHAVDASGSDGSAVVVQVCRSVGNQVWNYNP